ncbi:probable WRKY transcription factor 2 [Prosopis cineraria]|uniref:probable WRKY transcription factor 2 n=1 Tax=Prosopis cineraria TaxID=364024 RepID=UPI00240F5F8C|nr:probable WRKY transcription factor 2 [Prosopis cineraria]XP_054797921.1 probable WRKY transcription factor 2 [Prosopis cineraria]XP_054797922.1 probable WRKY transcription factor 2 [Prosopis cineraria]XP_054797923.1 probable WRKY transcription factor 2 [Prosopis cineraria]
MAGIDDNVTLISDWGPPTPSPRTFFSKMLGEDNLTRQISEPPGSGSRTGESFLRNEELIMTGNFNTRDRAPPQDDASGGQLTDSTSLSDNKSSSRGNLVERMAARAGFNAPRLNTESIRSADPTLNLDARSAYFTIPPGLSPTSLLESPVFLSNSLAQPSPTTGKFPFIANGNFRGSEPNSGSPEKSKDNDFDDIYASSFAFKTTTDLGSFYNDASTKINPTTLPEQYLTVEVSGSAPDFTDSPSQNDNKASVEEPADEEGDQRGNGDSPAAGAGGTPSEDGYNWRKYGQKHVKGSEFPRSYYKCTNTNCPVKKKVERSHEGHITEIIYKGNHNHPKPPTNRRSAIGSVNNPLSDMQADISESAEPQGGGDGELGWASTQKGNIARNNTDWKYENPEVTSPAAASVGPEFCNQSTNLLGQNGARFESGDAVDASSTFSNDEDDDDRGTHGSVSAGYEGEGDESESKRRKLESYPNTAELSGATRAIREPRVVVQTTSEVDILDDGYRWRKYGQKVVKGNPNPRSYYKCTNVGCTVRKHVERASHDLKSVITTYEGKHNHDVPAARNSNQGNAAASSAAAQATSVIHGHRAEAPQVHNGIGRLDRPALGLRSFSLPGAGPGPGRPQLGHGGFSFGIGMNQSGFPNLATVAALGPAHAKLPIMPVHPFLPHQCPPNEMGFMLPKGEPNLDPIPDRGVSIPAGSSVYQDIMSRMPLGPHM